MLNPSVQQASFSYEDTTLLGNSYTVIYFSVSLHLCNVSTVVGFQLHVVCCIATILSPRLLLIVELTQKGNAV